MGRAPRPPPTKNGTLLMAAPDLAYFPSPDERLCRRYKEQLVILTDEAQADPHNLELRRRLVLFLVQEGDEYDRAAERLRRRKNRLG